MRQASRFRLQTSAAAGGHRELRLRPHRTQRDAVPWLSDFETGRTPGGSDRVAAVLAALGLSLAVHVRPVTVIDAILAAHTTQPDD